MLLRIWNKCSNGFSALMARRLSDHQLAKACKILFAAMLIPLVVIAFYNYPADDDFSFTLPAATAWVETGSVAGVWQALWGKVIEMYQTWQGTYASSMHIAFSPMIVGIEWYFLANWAMLALMCLSVGYLLKGVLCHLLNVSKDGFWIVYTAVMILVLQFMPRIADGLYWHTGTVYTSTACYLFLMLGLLTRKPNPWRAVCLMVLGLWVGGGTYPAMLGAFTVMLLLTIHAFLTGGENRWLCLCAFVALTAGMLLNLLAPGNAVRFQSTAAPMSAPIAILKAVQESLKIVGRLMSPQLLGMLILIAAVLWNPIRESKWQFRHPLCAIVIFYGLFAASVAPAIYTRIHYETPRYYNVVYLYFLILIFGAALYTEGWAIRLLEREDHALLYTFRHFGKRFACGFLALVLALTAFGGFEFTIMNTSSVSALKSLVTGEAAQFKADMQERQEYIRVTDSDVVSVKPLDSQPYVFKRDQLPWQGIYGRVRYMKWYFELFYNAEHNP